MKRETFQTLLGPFVVSVVFGVFAGLGALAHYSEHGSQSASWADLVPHGLIAFVLASLGCFMVFGVVPWLIHQLFTRRRVS